MQRPADDHGKTETEETLSGPIARNFTEQLDLSLWRRMYLRCHHTVPEMLEGSPDWKLDLWS